MNRAGRRAFAKNLSKALGRKAEAHRPAEPTGPSPEERLAKLEARNVELEEQLQGLQNRHDQVPGVQPGRKDWYVHVGGERVDLKAIPAAEWLKTAEELPEFLFAYAIQKVEKPTEGIGDKISEVVDLAKRWIDACAKDPSGVDLDLLTVPEAEHAVAHIAELNGVTAHLRNWFRSRLQGMATAARSRPAVRAAAEQPTGDLPN